MFRIVHSGGDRNQTSEELNASKSSLTEKLVGRLMQVGVILHWHNEAAWIQNTD